MVLSGAASAAEVAKSGVVNAATDSGPGVALGWSGALPTPVLDGNTATYPNVQPNVDLVVKVMSTRVEEYYVLKAKPTGAFNVRIPLSNKGLTPSVGSDGSISFKDAKKRIAATIPTAYMWDAREDADSGLPAHAVKAGMTFDATANAMTLTADSALMADPNLTYPVTLDPSVSIAPTMDTFVRSDFPTTTYATYTPEELQVGTYNSGTTKARAFLNFSSSGFHGADVTSATLKLYEFHSYNCTASKMWVMSAGLGSNGTNWNNQPSMNTAYSGNVTTAKGETGCAAAYVNISVTNVIHYLALAGSSTIGVGLKAASETDNTSWKRFNSEDAASNKPSLSVTYNRYPATATAPTVASASPQM